MRNQCGTWAQIRTLVDMKKIQHKFTCILWRIFYLRRPSLNSYQANPHSNAVIMSCLLTTTRSRVIFFDAFCVTQANRRILLSGLHHKKLASVCLTGASLRQCREISFSVRTMNECIVRRLDQMWIISIWHRHRQVAPLARSLHALCIKKVGGNVEEDKKATCFTGLPVDAERLSTDHLCLALLFFQGQTYRRPSKGTQHLSKHWLPEHATRNRLPVSR